MTRRILLSILGGTFIFLLNHLAPISGALATPGGHEPTGFITSADVPQYLAFIEAARTHWLLPNIHMITPGEPAMFHPLALFAGKFAQAAGLSNGQIYYAIALILHWLCMAAWLWLLEVYCPTPKQRLAAIALTVCAVPLKLMALPASLAGSLPREIVASGMIQYGFETSDNFLRAGLGLAWCTGALAVMTTMTLAALYVRGRAVYGLLTASVFANAFLHPFEVAFTVPLAAMAILLGWGPPRTMTEKIRAIAPLGLAAVAGLAPYVWMTLRHGWVAEIAKNNHWQAPWPGWVFLGYGVPAILAVYLLMVRGKLTEAGDKLLLLWLGLPVALMYVPVIPFASHLYNGYAYLLGILVVRLWVTHKKLGRIEPRFAMAGLAMASVLALGGFYWRLAADGRAADPEMLTSSVMKPERRELLEWIREKTRREALVIAPLDLAPWLPTIGRRAPGSHDIVSGLRFKESARDLEALYEPKQSPDKIAGILSRYPAEFVIAAENTAVGEWLGSHAERRFAPGGMAVYAMPQTSVRSSAGIGIALSARNLQKCWIREHHTKQGNHYHPWLPPLWTPSRRQAACAED